MDTATDLRIDHDGDALRVVLTRPRAINSLTGGMLEAIGGAVVGARTLELSGEGPRGYCAGADVRELRSLAMRDPQAAGDWLAREYAVDLAVSRLAGTAHLHGVSMGGGLGLAARLHVVSAADLVLAMPETGIGLWPDVGMCFELSRAPRFAGRHLAMTGASIDAASALWAGLVDEVDGGADADGSDLARDADWIEECYASTDPVEVLRRLAERPEAPAREAAELIATRSPLSVAVALEAVVRAEEAAGVAQVLATDEALGRSFMRSSDFVEGVRAQLVDKDRRPHWRHRAVDEVTRAEVEAMFDPD
ncbi:enoyl-CoA hydratase/isomerase family protein [Acidipropionibacterium timonense]|uniref:enoyl-CoA hydratase/isomerase family protein n=1 Tax=Acidipropionibacterium timonense TaxID=2161818 RepID=UPI001031FA5D|nr:enoyl-CoA hydratase/isomerase family protein [Acidipropionibacterium timonense]